MFDTPQDPATLLSHSQLFHGMPKADLESLIKLGKLSKTAAGGILIEEEGRVEGIQILLDGSVQVVKRGGAKVSQLGRGSFFGEIYLFGLAMGATASITSPQGCTSLLLTREGLQKWFASFPKHELTFYKHLATELCNRLYSTTEKLAGG